MADLSKQEEHILLAAWKLKENAYGIPIRKYLKEVTGGKISIGGIYVPLDRLVRKGYLVSYQGDPLPERGGMSRRYYKLTTAGIEALEKARAIHQKLWEGLEDMEYAPEELS